MDVKLNRVRLNICNADHSVLSILNKRIFRDLSRSHLHNCSYFFRGQVRETKQGKRQTGIRLRVCVSVCCLCVI